MTTDTILVCDPDPQMQRAFKLILRRAGYNVHVTGCGVQALEHARAQRPAAVIMEWILPDLDGVQICRRLRQHGQMPVIVVSELDDEHAKIAAFRSGADDYVSKPFSSGELLARLAARLRAAPSPLWIETQGLTIDLTAHLVTREGQEVRLTATEFALLRVLATSRGTVTYGTLQRKVWGVEHGEIPPRLRVHVANLRAKLGGGDPFRVIVTDPGIGYRFAAAAPVSAAHGNAL